MIPILYLASDLTPGSGARHLARLAAGLDRARFRVEVAVLESGPSTSADELEAAGIPVHHTPLRSAIDWGSLRKLRRAAGELDPAILHAWGPRALVASRSLTRTRADEAGNAPRLVVSEASYLPQAWSDWWTRRRLRSCDRVVAGTWAAAKRYRELGVHSDRLTRISPGIVPPPIGDRNELLRSLDLPANTRYIVTAGRLEPDTGFKFVIWAFDLVRHEYPDLHLVILGDGPARAALEDYARSTMFDDLRVRFAGDRGDGYAIIAEAAFAWIPQPRGDIHFALETQAAGVPVLGWNRPDLAEVIDDGRSGILVSANEPAQLAAKTYPLITNSTACRTLGDAGLDLAARFTLEREVELHESLYEEMA